jgi:hypothetical protein
VFAQSKRVLNASTSVKSIPHSKPRTATARSAKSLNDVDVKEPVAGRNIGILTDMASIIVVFKREGSTYKCLPSVVNRETFVHYILLLFSDNIECLLRSLAIESADTAEEIDGKTSYDKASYGSESDETGDNTKAVSNDGFQYDPTQSSAALGLDKENYSWMHSYYGLAQVPADLFCRNVMRDDDYDYYDDEMEDGSFIV